MLAIALSSLCLFSPVDAIFDGKTLNGWTQRNGTAKYWVEDGCIVGETVTGSPNSFLCSNKMYGDFELEFDVKVDDRLNSGCQIRSMSVPGYDNYRVHGYQVEIDPVNHESAGIYDEARRGWLDNGGKNPALQKAFKNGQWNHYKVIAKGARLQTWLNGVTGVDVHDDLTQWGFIGLQVHAADKAGLQVRWKNIKLTDHGISSLTPPKNGKWLLHSEKDMANWVSERDPKKPNPWKWMGNYMEVAPGTGDLITKENLGQCRIHVEFMTDENHQSGQANGNSGVYVQRRYEVQILNSAPRGPLDNECGGIYTIAAPKYAMALKAGEWQTYDIEFTPAVWSGSKKTADAMMSVYHNGTKIHDRVALTHTTAGGIDESPMLESLRLQDHGHPIRFRNIWVEKLK